MSHTMAWKADVAAHGLWSISRGLARGLDSRSEYKQMMDLADTPREGALDGRGNLSERALIDFIAWFLRVAIDQVGFMASLFELDNLARRLRGFVAERDTLKPEAARLLEETQRPHKGRNALIGQSEGTCFSPVPCAQLGNSVPAALSSYLNRPGSGR
jgi:hypothetical protein